MTGLKNFSHSKANMKCIDKSRYLISYLLIIFLVTGCELVPKYWPGTEGIPPSDLAEVDGSLFIAIDGVRTKGGYNQTNYILPGTHSITYLKRVKELGYVVDIVEVTCPLKFKAGGIYTRQDVSVMIRDDCVGTQAKESSASIRMFPSFAFAFPNMISNFVSASSDIEWCGGDPVGSLMFQNPLPLGEYRFVLKSKSGDFQFPLMSGDLVLSS